MKIKTKELLLAIERIQKDANGTIYMDVTEEHGKLELSAMDGKALDHKVTIYEADANRTPKLTTETKLGGLK